MKIDSCLSYSRAQMQRESDRLSTLLKDCPKTYTDTNFTFFYKLYSTLYLCLRYEIVHLLVGIKSCHFHFCL